MKKQTKKGICPDCKKHTQEVNHFPTNRYYDECLDRENCGWHNQSQKTCVHCKTEPKQLNSPLCVDCSVDLNDE